MGTSLYNNGQWKEPNSVFAKVSGVWTPVKKVWVLDNGVWVEVYSTEIVITATSSASLDVSALFGTDWSGSKKKRLIVPNSEVIGSMNIPTGLGGNLIIENDGQIIGQGGSANGGNGGSAITASSDFELINTGAVLAGGGGGGKGGDGGDGEELSEVREPSSGSYGANSSYYFKSGYAPPGTIHPYLPTAYYEVMWNGTVVIPMQYMTGETHETMQAVDPNDSSITYFKANSGGKEPVYRTASQQVTTSGGAGGDGGQGKGYNQSLAAGDAGAAGGTNAGDGGDGGSGGGFGQAGITGASGQNGSVTNGSSGASGGSAGAAVEMISGSLTLNNSGTISGAA